MKSVVVTAPGVLTTIDVPVPEIGPRDVLVAIRACGICGADPHALSEGGIPPLEQPTPLGHEPAGEIVEVGDAVEGLQVGDHVVIEPMGPTGIIGGGAEQGALSEFVRIADAADGVNVKVIPDHIPWEVAALNEPMAVALRAVNRTEPQPDAKVVVFGAGPIGLGALLGFRRRGAAHVVVVDVQPNRLEKALRIGADAVIDSSKEDVMARLVELHGSASDAFGRTGLPATDIYLDAAGVPAVLRTVLGGTKLGATLGIVAIHKKPVEVDFQMLIPSELDIRMSMGHPTEIFEVTDDIVENWEKYALIVSDLVPFAEAARAIDLAGRPGTTDKVVVTF